MEEGLPMSQLEQGETAKGVEPIDLFSKGRINDIATADGRCTKSMRAEGAHSQRSDYVAPGAVHIVRRVLEHC